MANNRAKRNGYLVVLILGVIGLISILIIEMLGIDVNNWIFYTDLAAIIVGGIFYKNFRQAVKEDDKYGTQ